MVNVLKKILDFGIYFEENTSKLVHIKYIFQVYRNPIFVYVQCGTEIREVEKSTDLTTLEYVFGSLLNNIWIIL